MPVQPKPATPAAIAAALLIPIAAGSALAAAITTLVRAVATVPSDFAPFKPSAYIGLIVVGVEATWTSSAISGNYAIPALAAGTQAESRSEPTWFATLTGRLGYAANDLLFYAKGGAAYMHVDYTQISLIGGVSNGQQQIIDNREGFTVGGGIEYAFNENLSAKLEYDFLDFGTKNYNFTAMAAGGLPVSIKSDVHLLTAGLNYRYNLSGIFGP